MTTHPSDKPTKDPLKGQETRSCELLMTCDVDEPMNNTEPLAQGLERIYYVVSKGTFIPADPMTEIKFSYRYVFIALVLWSIFIGGLGKELVMGLFQILSR